MKIGKFKIPNKAAITARTSSLTNSFIASLMPYIKPSPEDLTKALRLLEMDEELVSCIYCGGKHTEWDHLKPFVVKRRPTGFYTTSFNLVPACGKCNQSKGNSDWQTWMHSARRSLPDLGQRIKLLKAYEKAGRIKPINVEAILGKERFEAYMSLCNEIITKMGEAHKVSRELNQEISTALGIHQKQRCTQPKAKSATTKPKPAKAKDYSKYRLNNTPHSLRKGRLALEIVLAHVKRHPGISFKKLKKVFPDSLQKLPTFNYDVFRPLPEAKRLLSGQIRYFVNTPIKLIDAEIAVCTQWAVNNIDRLINRAREVGFTIKKV